MCQYFSNFQAVFIGKATQIADVKYGGHTVTFDVVEMFRGTPTKTITVDTYICCGYPQPALRTTYLVMAGTRDGRLTVMPCGGYIGSTDSRWVQSEIQRIRLVKATQGTGTVFGSINEWHTDFESDELKLDGPIDFLSIFVSAKNGTEYKTHPDERGLFILQVPPGHYSARADKGAGWFNIESATKEERAQHGYITDPDYFGDPNMPFDWHEQGTVDPNGFDLEGGSCATLSFRVIVDGAIAGTVTGVEGKPVSGVTVAAYPTKLGAPSPHDGRKAVTDKDGSYFLPRLEEGDYVVFLPAKDGSTISQYFTHSKTRDGATIVHVESRDTATANIVLQP
jgi:carboxypeptidase family protein